MDNGNGHKVPLKSWTQYGNDGGVYVNTLIPLDSNLNPEQAAKATTTEVYGVDSQPAANIMISNEQSKIITPNNDLISGPSVANELFNKNEVGDIEKQQRLQLQQQQQQQQQQQLHQQQQQQQQANHFVAPIAPQPIQSFRPQNPPPIPPPVSQQIASQVLPQTNLPLPITPAKMQQAREQLLQQNRQQQEAAAFLETFKHITGSPSTQTVTSGFHQTSSQLNPVTGFQDIPLGTLVIPSGVEAMNQPLNSLQPLTHVIGENKHSVPKLAGNVTVNEITSPALPTQTNTPLQHTPHIGPSMFKPLTTGQILSPETQTQSLVSDAHNNDRMPNIERHNENGQTEGFLASSPKQIANTPVAGEVKKEDKQYPQPKNFGMDYVLQKKKEALIKQQNEIFWEKNKQTGNLLQGDYPNPAPFQLKPTNKSRPQWPQQPMKLKVSFEPTNEGKVEMKINGPFDQFGKKIPLAATSLIKPSDQKPNVQNKDYQRLTEEEKSTLEKQRQRELQVEAIRNKLESKYIAPVNRNYKDPPLPSSLRPSDPLSGLRRPLVRVAIPRNINNSVIMTSHLPVKDQNGELEKKVKTLSIKLPINVSLATVLKNIYEHMYEYYFHKRPMLGTKKEDAAAKKVIQGLIAENMKNITNIVQTKSLSQMQARQAATLANLKKIPLKNVQNSKTLMSFQNAKLSSQAPPKAQNTNERNLKVKQQSLVKNVASAKEAKPPALKAQVKPQQAKPAPVTVTQQQLKAAPAPVTPKLPASLADQKDLYKKLTSRENKETQLPMNAQTGDFAPQALNGILVSEVPEDTDGITRSFHSAPSWRTFKGSIESYLGRLQDLQQRNKLTLHNDVVQPLLNLPLAVIADEHARRRGHLKFDPSGRAYVNNKPLLTDTQGDLRTRIGHLQETKNNKEESQVYTSSENSHQRDIKGPSLYQISKGQSAAQFNQVSQNYVALNMKNMNNKEYSLLRNAALRFQKQGVKASSTPSNYFLIDTTGVANNKPMVIQTVEEFMQKQALKNKFAREKKAKQAYLRKQAIDAADRLKHNSMLIQNGFVPLETGTIHSPGDVSKSRENPVQTSSNIIPNQIVSVPEAENNRLIQSQHNVNQQQQQHNNKQLVPSPRNPPQAFRRIIDPSTNFRNRPVIRNKPALAQQRHFMPNNLNGFVYNAPILIPSSRIKGPILVSKSLPPKSRLAQLIKHPYKIVPMASKRLIGRPIKALILPSLSRSNTYLRNPYPNIKQFIRPIKSNDENTIASPVSIGEKISEFVNPNIAKGSYYTFKEELEEAQRQKAEAPYLRPRPTVSPKEIMEAVKNPGWDKKLVVPQLNLARQNMRKPVYARRNRIPYQRLYITNIEQHPVYSKIRALKKRSSTDEKRPSRVLERYKSSRQKRKRKSIEYLSNDIDIMKNSYMPEETEKKFVTKRSINEIKTLFQKYKSQHHSKQDIHHFIKRLKKRLLKLKKQREKSKDVTHLEAVKTKNRKTQLKKDIKKISKPKHKKHPHKKSFEAPQTSSDKTEIFDMQKQGLTDPQKVASIPNLDFQDSKKQNGSPDIESFNFNSQNIMKSNKMNIESSPNNGKTSTDFNQDSSEDGSGESMLFQELTSAAKQNHISIENAIASLKTLKGNEEEEIPLLKTDNHITAESFMQPTKDNIIEKRISRSKIMKKNFKKSEIEKFTFNTPRPVSQNIFNDFDMGANNEKDKKGQDSFTSSMELQTKKQHELNFSSRKK